jgi:PAS domain S-box-containing protein
MRKFTLSLSALVALLGAVVIVGWYLHIPLLLQIHPSFVAMQYNTALGFLLAGLATLALQHSMAGLSRLLAAGVLLIGGLTLLQIVTGIDLHIDQLFMRHYILVKTSSPGRMSPNTALCFTLAGTGIVMLNTIFLPKAKAFVHAFVAPAIMALALIALSGYLFSVDTAFGWGNLTRMAVHTSGGFVLLGMVLYLQNLQDRSAMNLPGIGVALLVLVLTLWQALETQGATAVREKVRQRIEQIKSEWQYHMQEHLQDLQMLVRRQENATAAGLNSSQDIAEFIKDFGYLGLIHFDQADKQVFSFPLTQSDAAIVERAAAAVPAANCRPESAPSTLLVEVAQVPEPLVVIVAPAQSGCFVAVRLFLPTLERARTKIRTQRYPLTAFSADRAIFKEVSDGAWFVEGALDTDGVKLRLQLTPTRTQQAVGALPAVVLGAGLAISALLLLALYWINIARRSAAEALHLHAQVQENLTLFEQVIEHAPYGIVLANRQGKIILINHALEHLFGYTSFELIGQSIELLLPIELRAAHVHKRDNYLRNESEAKRMAPDRVLQGRHKNGKLFALQVDLAPVTLGAEAGAIAMVVDISAQVAAQRAIDAHLKKVESINEELNNFAYIASHDLKSPLRGIDQLASWIAEDLGENIGSDTREHLRLMRSRISRMEMLLDDLLAYSRVGRSDDEIVTVDSRQLLTDIFEMQSARKPMHLQLADNMPVLQTQKVPLELVFRNLIANAMKHHDKAEGTICVAATENADGFEFTVQDDGPGIPLEHQQRVFAMFQTLRPRDEVEGSGIGLALVMKAVLSVGGTVSVESDGVHGCTFRFTWPRTIQKEMV